ncbi:MAG TPA: HAMP domain-containing sensor histidine kinase [Devosia sp.]|nr:HAMP domain-containing sensor histidine kinase [Devosia sp.]
MPAPSLTRRLIWTLTVAAVALWAVAALLAGNVMRSRLDQAFDGGLKETAERVLALAVDDLRDDGDEQGFRHEMHEVPQSRDDGNEYIVYQVRLADGSITLRSHDAPDQPFDVPLTEGFANSGPWRVYTIGLASGELFIQAAEALQHRSDTLWSGILSILLPVGILIPLSALGIFLAVRSGLRPVRQFSDQIGARHASNLAPIGDTGLPRELLPIAHAVDGLIGRIAAAIEAERAFAANSAHELRTPVAGSLAQTQLLVSELADQPQRDRARQIEESLLRLRAITDKLLQLSRAEAGVAASGKPVDLVPALRVLIEDVRRGARDRDVSLVIPEGLALMAAIDLDIFGIMMRNLLENALLHGEPPILVRAAPGCIAVSNGGPVVPPATLARLKTRFARGKTIAPGSGLGLAIADAIAAQAGWALELASPRPGHADGFQATVRFAAAAPPVRP